MSKLLLEKTRRELINQSKAAAPVKSYGTTRYERKNKQHIYNSITNFNKIDMNALFQGNMLSFKVPVHGETDNYEVEVLFEGICDGIKREVKRNKNKFEYKCVYRAIIDSINKQDIYIGCSCPDWCLEGSTKIKLLNGEVYTVEELKDKFDSGEDLWVYSTDSNGDFKPGHVNDVWVSGYTTELVKVTLDNGEEILTTPNHKYMLRDGSYLEAEKLQSGQSLMPLYFRDTNGYENVKLNSKKQTSYFSVYKLVANELLKEEIDSAKIRSGEEVIAIHHIDFNKKNNYPSNLKPMGVQEHYKYHYEHVKESGVLDKWIKAGQEHNRKVKDHSTEEYKIQAKVMHDALWSDNGYYLNRTQEEIDRDFTVHSNATKSAWARGCYNTEAFNNASKQRGVNLHTPEVEALALQGIRNHYNNLSDEERTKISNRNKVNSKTGWQNSRDSYMKSEKFMTARKHGFDTVHTEENLLKSKKSRLEKYGNENYNNPQKMKVSRCLRNLKELIEKNIPLTEENFYANRRNGDPHWSKVFSSFNSMLEYFGLNAYNHKVKSVEFIKYENPIPVYDLSVEKWNNFYINAGVILHNCYRFSYWATKDRYNGGRPEVRVADITNPNNNQGAGCKHTIAVLYNLDWAMKLATSISNYVEYMQENYEDKFKRLIFPAIFDISYDEYISDEADDELANSMDNEEDVEEIDKSIERSLYKPEEETEEETEEVTEVE